MIKLNDLTKNLTNIIIIFLLVILAFKACRNSHPATQISIHRDTTWIIKDCTIYSRPQPIKVIPATQSKEYYTKQYLPDTNYLKLLSQYREVVNKLLSTNIVRDSSKIDSIGSVFIEDTVYGNAIIGRSIRSSLQYPIVKEYLTVQEKKRNQLYAGFSVFMGSNTAISGGFLFKNKKDNAIGLSVGLNNIGVFYGASYYTKIKLK